MFRFKMHKNAVVLASVLATCVSPELAEATALPPGALPPPVASLEYFERNFGQDDNDDRIIDEPNTFAYVNPSSRAVLLDACGSVRAETYHWRLPRGVTIRKARHGKCYFHARFPSEGTYDVALRVRDVNGNESAPVTRVIVVEDYLIVSIGDSIASGEGNPDIPQKFGKWTGYLKAKARWANRWCHRSSRYAAPAQAARSLDNADPHTSVTFVHLACTGAKVDDVAGQIAKARSIVANRRIDALLVSVGANDIGFANILRQCYLVPSCHRVGALANSTRDKIANLTGRFDQLSAAIRTLPVSPDRVYISEYPDPTANERGEFVDLPGFLGGEVTEAYPFDGIGAGEMKWAAEEIVTGLNREVHAAALRHGWTHVDGIATRFRGPGEGHGYPAEPLNRWIRTAEESVLLQGPWPWACSRNDFVDWVAGALTLGELKVACKAVKKYMVPGMTKGTFHPLASGGSALGGQEVMRDALLAKIRLDRPPILEASLVPASHTVIAGGDRDGIIEPTEDVTANVSVRNTGAEDVRDVNGTLVPLSALTVMQATSPYPDIASGASGSNLTPFAGRYIGGCGARLFIKERLSTAGARRAALEFSVPTGQPGTPTTYRSTDVPQDIERVDEDENAHGAIIRTPSVNTSILPVNSRGYIKRITVHVDEIRHPAAGRLAIALVAPDGRRILLSNYRGAAGVTNDFLNTTFDDMGNPVRNAKAPFSTVLQPDGLLENFDGVSQNGIWRLEVLNMSPKRGVIKGWSITTWPAECDPDIPPIP